MSNANDFVIENGVLKKYKGFGGEVTIPDGVTSIGDEAFFACESLSGITIPFGVTNIGESAFRKCRTLTHISIPASVTHVGALAFYDCESINTFNISNLLRWCKIAFKGQLFSNPIQLYLNDEPISELVIPDGVSCIENCTFSNCSNITKVVIPDGVTAIGYEAFAGCTSLTEINLPDSIESIGYGAFRDCTSLKKINIPENVIEIKFRLFYNCESLTEILLHEFVFNIGDEAFYRCRALTGIVIPEEIMSIGRNAFLGCNNLKELLIPLKFLQENHTSDVDAIISLCSTLTDLGLMRPDYYASILLFQTHKLYKALLKRKDAVPEEVMRAAIQILGKNKKAALYERAAEYCISHKDDISFETKEKLYEILKKSKAKKIQMMVEDIVS